MDSYYSSSRGRHRSRSRSNSNDSRPELMRRESFSSSCSSRRRPKWYNEVPILGSVVRTMKDILGLDDSMRYRYREYQHIGSSRRRRRKRSSTPDDEYHIYRRRRNSSSRTRPPPPPPQPQPQQRRYYDEERQYHRVYYSPGLKPQHESGWGGMCRDRDRDRYHDHDHDRNRDRDPFRDPFLERPFRSSSASSYTRSRHPDIIEISPGTRASTGTESDTESEPRVRRCRVSFADPLETPPRSQKCPSIDDQTGSRKRNPHDIRERGRFYSERSTSTSTSTTGICIREPRPRSPVIERRPLRSGHRFSIPIPIPAPPRRRGSPVSDECYDYNYDNDKYKYNYVDIHEDVEIPYRERERRPYPYSSDVEIIERSPTRPRSERRGRQYSGMDMDRPPDIESRIKEIDARSRRVLDEAKWRKSSLRGRRDEFEVRRS